MPLFNNMSNMFIKKKKKLTLKIQWIFYNISYVYKM
jgi:hypothetical protein